MAAKTTRMSREAASETEQENKPSQAMVALFATKSLDTSKLVRRNAPPMVKPGDVPMDGVVSGEIIDVIDSPVSTIKGKLLWLRHESGMEFTFPCTGVIRNALVPGIKSDESKELQTALEKEKGKLFIAKRLPDKTSAKFKKTMFMFDVFTSVK